MAVNGSCLPSLKSATHASQQRPNFVKGCPKKHTGNEITVILFEPHEGIYLIL
jgi:hypothetical protein